MLTYASCVVDTAGFSEISEIGEINIKKLTIKILVAKLRLGEHHITAMYIIKKWSSLRLSG